MLRSPLLRSAVAGVSLAFLLAAEATAGPLRLGKAEIEVDGGTMGTFSLAYPKLLLKDSKDFESPMEQRAEDGKVILKYPSGIMVQVALADGGTIVYQFSGPRERLQTFRVGELLIPFNYSEGGTWRAGNGDTKPFPPQQPPRPFLFQGNADRFEFTNVDGQCLRFAIPAYSFQQLQDNREWGWKVFAWWFQTPVDPNQDTYRVTVAHVGADADAKVLVDRFGQTTRKEFPGRVASIEELRQDVRDEAAYYASLAPPARNAFGGLPGSGGRLGLRRTGFFHVERRDDRWILVDPAGDAFFHLGICSFGFGEDYTYIEGRESIYEWLPERTGEFAAAYHPETYWNPRAFSFYRANLIRKYGGFSDEAFYERMIGRIRQAGFNSVGAFSGGSATYRKLHFPYVATLPLGQWSLGSAIPGVRGVFDPFDETVLKKIDDLFAKSLPGAADEPLLIGYFLENEQGFEDLPRAVAKLDGTHACKRRLVSMLEERYPDIAACNTAWGMDAPSFAALADQGLPVVTKAAFADLEAFTELFLDAYYRAIVDTFRTYDANHMLIGNRWQPGTANSEVLCRVAGKYLDVVSINYYTEGIDTAFARRLYRWSGERPQMWSEFFYTAEQESNVAGRLDVATQRERGQAYRYYIETAASLGFVVGTEWFTLIDQAVTGRFFEKYNGERQNTGLFNVCDRPYREAIAEMAAAHRNVYAVWLDGQKPYLFDHPRFTGKGQATRTIQAGRALGPMTIDGQLENWPGRPPERIGADRLVVGSEAEGLEASFKVCWDEQALYLLVQVADATPLKNDQQGGDLWSADGIELFIGHEDLDRAGPFLFTDRQILLGAGNPARTHVVNAGQQPAIAAVAVPAVDGTGYTLEAAIPWTALAVEPHEGLELLFDLGVDDSPDGRSRRAQIMWNGIARNSSDRGAWGRLVLVR